MKSKLTTRKVSQQFLWRLRMRKHGRFAALRNIPVGWLMQTMTATDWTERFFRVILELVVWLVIYMLAIFVLRLASGTVAVLLSFFVAHTILWPITGGMLVYFQHSFGWLKNPGLEVIIPFLRRLNRMFSASNCAKAVLVYGSMCRREFRDTSDIDLRIIRKRGFRNAVNCLLLGLWARTIAFFLLIPSDICVVDSMRFINKQMREDEYPIVIYLAPDFTLDKRGLTLEELEKNPHQVLKSNRCS